VRKVSDVGRHAVVEAMVGDTPVKAVVDAADVEQGAEVHLAFRPDQTRLYRDGWIATEVTA
jgi:glycerol transport system ATP-binding protein